MFEIPPEKKLKKFLPEKKIGYLSPLEVIDNAAYQFYHLLPDRIMMVMVPVGLQEFSTRDVARVFAPLKEKLAMLMDRGVDMVVQAGVPLPIIMGLAYHDKLVARIAKTTGKPATSQVVSVVAAAKSLGIKNIALANKWTDQMNKNLGRFFAREGIGTAGVYSHPMVPSQFVKLRSEDSINLAYELGRGALVRYPEADGLYIGGGAWITFPLVKILEKEFGKPVLTNEVATTWHACHMLDCWRPRKGFGRLLESTV